MKKHITLGLSLMLTVVGFTAIQNDLIIGYMVLIKGVLETIWVVKNEFMS